MIAISFEQHLWQDKHAVVQSGIEIIANLVETNLSIGIMEQQFAKHFFADVLTLIRVFLY
jgi:hypothetical protein